MFPIKYITFIFICLFVSATSLSPGIDTVLKKPMETSTTASTVAESVIGFNSNSHPSSISKNDNLQPSSSTNNMNHGTRRLNDAGDSLGPSIPIASSSTSLSSMNVGLSVTGEGNNFQNVLAFPGESVQSPPAAAAAPINTLSPMDNSGAPDAVSLPSPSDIKGAGLDSKKIRPIEKKGKVHKSVDLSRVNSLRSSSVVSSTGGVDGARPNDAIETSEVSDGGSVSSTFLSSINNVRLSNVDENKNLGGTIQSPPSPPSLPPPPAAIGPLASMDNSSESDAISLPSFSSIASFSTIKGAGLDSKNIRPIEKNGKNHIYKEWEKNLSRVNSLQSSSVVPKRRRLAGDWLDMTLYKDTAKQKTTWDHPASNAVDGNTATFSRTKDAADGGTANKWWSVELGEERTVTEVKTTARVDCCHYRLNGAKVYVGNNLDTTPGNIIIDGTQCGSAISGATSAGPFSIVCDPPVKGKMIKIYRPDRPGGANDPLHLADVKVQVLLPPTCSFSTYTIGTQTVPATGCKLSQMISLQGDMTVTGGTDTSKIMHELHAVGGTASGRTRHFFNKGKKLTLRWLKLIGGKVDSTSHGGSILTEGGILDVADSMFLGCGSSPNTQCAKNGGAVRASGAATMKFLRTTFQYCNAINGGAIAVTTAILQVTDSTFKSNSADRDGGRRLHVLV